MVTLPACQASRISLTSLCGKVAWCTVEMPLPMTNGVRRSLAVAWRPAGLEPLRSTRSARSGCGRRPPPTLAQVAAAHDTSLRILGPVEQEVARKVLHV